MLFKLIWLDGVMGAPLTEDQVAAVRPCFEPPLNIQHEETLVPHKVLYNASYGGFSLSEEMERILNHMGLDPYTIARHDPRLIDLVQEIGIENAASSAGCNLEIAYIDSDRYLIEEYDGLETVVEPKDLFWINATSY